VNYLRADDLIREPKTEDCEIKGLGLIKVRELTRSQKLSFDAWLRPKGELDKKRDKVKDLKLCTLSLLNENGDLLMDYDNAGFDLFIEQIGEKAAGVWSDVAYHVLRVNGYIDAEDDDILGE